MITPARKLSLVVFLCTYLFAAQTPAKEYDCFQIRPVGICIWVFCTFFFCKIRVTPKIGHFNPDVWVQVSNLPSGVDRAEDPKRTDTYNRNHQNLIFQSAVSIGHFLTGKLYCPSNTSPLIPYFWSQFDVPSWSWGGLDLLTASAWIPGVHEIGHWPTNNWGHLYPRGGWTIQHSEPKSAAIVAQRVGDIITRDDEPHIYKSIHGESSFVAEGGTPKTKKQTWSPKSLIENSNEGGWYQMNFPKFKQCMVFGENDTKATTEWGGGLVSETGNYLYTLWRPYTCCEKKKGALIVIDFTSYPTPIIKN